MFTVQLFVLDVVSGALSAELHFFQHGRLLKLWPHGWSGNFRSCSSTVRNGAKKDKKDKLPELQGHNNRIVFGLVIVYL